jgi:hypothetical protein
MGLNLGKWSDAERNMLLAGASNELIMARTGRTLFSVRSARSKMSKHLGKYISPIPDSKFLAEERRKIRELRKQRADAMKENAESKDLSTRPKKVIDIDEMRKKREKEWVPTASGAGVMCVPKKKLLLRDNIVRYNSDPTDPKPVDPKIIHTEKLPLETKKFKKVEPEVINPEIDQIMKGIPTPSKDELFFVVNGTRVTVSAGTKKVDIMPYGLIIEF